MLRQPDTSKLYKFQQMANLENKSDFISGCGLNAHSKSSSVSEHAAIKILTPYEPVPAQLLSTKVLIGSFLLAK
jgi:hypothetical protein